MPVPQATYLMRGITCTSSADPVALLAGSWYERHDGHDSVTAEMSLTWQQWGRYGAIKVNGLVSRCYLCGERKGHFGLHLRPLENIHVLLCKACRSTIQLIRHAVTPGPHPPPAPPPSGGLFFPPRAVDSPLFLVSLMSCTQRTSGWLLEHTCAHQLQTSCKLKLVLWCIKYRSVHSPAWPAHHLAAKQCATSDVWSQTSGSCVCSRVADACYLVILAGSGAIRPA